MERKELVERIENAEMVLVGLGEDFDYKADLQKDKNYIRGCEKLKDMDAYSLIPAWDIFCMKKNNLTSMNEVLLELVELLKDKNYFIVSVSTNSVIADIPWKHGRVVMPCGSSKQKQCPDGCREIIQINESDERNLNDFFEQIYEDKKEMCLSPLIGTCKECGQPLVLNSIYTDNYNENGYMEQWATYMKWLQGTVNRRVLILELGVGMKFPSVIRWPFEKVAFFNQKSYFCRVHEKLYQLTVELSGKGCGISKNAIEWLRGL